MCSSSLSRKEKRAFDEIPLFYLFLKDLLKLMSTEEPAPFDLFHMVCLKHVFPPQQLARRPSTTLTGVSCSTSILNTSKACRRMQAILKLE
jgi:hypothetical protein